MLHQEGLQQGKDILDKQQGLLRTYLPQAYGGGKAYPAAVWVTVRLA